MHQILDRAYDMKALRPLARRYIWWEAAEEALASPRRVMAQVMNLGTFEDALLLLELVGEDELCEVLRHAEAGQFDARSWHYWHYRLGLADANLPPPALPVRALPSA